jgi:hypothetical protein
MPSARGASRPYANPYPCRSIPDSPPLDFTTYILDRGNADGLTVRIDDATRTIKEIVVIENRRFTTAGGTVTNDGPFWLGSTRAQVRREFGAPDFAAPPSAGGCF